MNNTKMILEFEDQTENQTEVERFVSDQIDEVLDDQEEYDDETPFEEERILPVGKKSSSTNYNASIDAIPVLSFEEEVRYARMVRTGSLLEVDDHSAQAQEIRRKAGLAKQVMIEHNLRLVRSIARKSEGRGVLLDDLIQEGTLGLMEAIDKYNPEYGFRFSTYAFQSIQQKIKRCIQDQGRDIRLPNNLQGKIAKIKSTQTFLLQQLEREASELEIAVCIGIGKVCSLEVLNTGNQLSDSSDGVSFGDFSPKDIKEMLGITKPIVRMDMPISEYDDREWIETVAVPETNTLKGMDLDSLRSILKKLLTILDEREATVIAYRYCLDGREKVTYEELGKRIGLTRERTRQIEKEALEALRSCRDSSQLLAFIG